MNEIFGKNKSCSLPKSMFLNDKTLTSRKQITESFNSYFSEIGENISPDIPNVNNTFTDFLMNKNDSTLFMKLTSVFEIIKFSNTLKPFKASGHDDISPKVVK